MKYKEENAFCFESAFNYRALGEAKAGRRGKKQVAPGGIVPLFRA